VKTDETLNQGDIVTLAKQIKNLSPGKMRTLTVPLGDTNGYYPGLGSVVIWDETLAPDLFNRMKNDLPIVDEVTPSPSASNKSKNQKESSKNSSTVIDKFKTRTANENPCGELK
jgi:hypothetical protein